MVKNEIKTTEVKEIKTTEEQQKAPELKKTMLQIFANNIDVLENNNLLKAKNKFNGTHTFKFKASSVDIESIKITVNMDWIKNYLTKILKAKIGEIHTLFIKVENESKYSGFNLAMKTVFAKFPPSIEELMI